VSLFDPYLDYEVEYEYEGRGMEPSQSIYMDVEWPFVALEEIRKSEGTGTCDDRMIKMLKDLWS
jgi:hypothetical protein